MLVDLENPFLLIQIRDNYSMARPLSSDRQWVEHVTTLDIRSCYKAYGGRQNLANFSSVSVSIGSPTCHRSVSVTLLKTIPNYGGVRYWFECPTCRTRVGRLYAVDVALGLRCRRCLNLVYALQYRKSGAFAYFHAMKTGRVTNGASGFLADRALHESAGKPYRRWLSPPLLNVAALNG